MKRKICKSLVALLLLGGTLSVASCGKRTETTTSGNNPTTNTPVTSSTSSNESPIKSLTAINPQVELRIDEEFSMTDYYEIKGYGALNNKQKACTYTTSDEKVVAFSSNKKKIIAKGLGDAEVTVTSTVDTTKTCSFKVTVKDVFFDHKTSSITPGDDFSKELIADGGTVESKAMQSGDYFIRGISSATWMTEVEVTIQDVLKEEEYPKFGIVASTLGNAAEGGENRVYFFLDAAIGKNGNYSWKNFGFCEVFNEANWAWNPGVSNSEARHADGCYSLPEGQAITSVAKFEEGSTMSTKFKMKVAHDGLAFHMWINDNYAASMNVLPYLFTGADGNPVESTCGFFQFKSHAIYSNYSATQDPTEVRAAIDGITNVRFLTDSDWAAD